MKKILTMAFVFVIFCGIVNAAHALPLNESFESFNASSFPADWTQVIAGTQNAYAVSSSEWSTDGQYSLKIFSNEKQSYGDYIGVQQSVDLTNVSKMTFDASIAVRGGNGCYLDVWLPELNRIIWSATLVDTYLDQEIDLSSYSGIYNLQIRYVWGSPLYFDPATVFVDNIRFEYENNGATVPEPATLLLLSMGLAGLACTGIRRKHH